MADLLKGALLLFVMLNPFLLSLYLRDLFEDLDAKTFAAVMTRGALIGGAVFAIFAIGGDRIFSDVLSVRFASFQIFGGVVFALIGLRYVFQGPAALRELRGTPEHIAGSIAMPVLIGPGTVSASVMLGARASIAQALVAIAITVTVVVVAVVILKRLYDAVKRRNAALVERYMDFVGRISALVIGTIAVELVLRGIDAWRPN
ncbi:MAG: MarC family protein [Myxococcales bacterium]|nr:MarC family protein [Myxococcales bacterium]